MRCPNCSKESAQGASECLNCGFIFAKWKSASAGPAGSPLPPAGAAGSSGVSLDTLLLFGLLLAVAGYYWTRPNAEATAEESPSSLGSSACAFSGEVLDIYSLEPASGVRVAFGPRVAAVTDAAGRYWVKDKPGLYAPALAGARYKPGFIAGFTRDWRSASFEERVRAARAAAGAANDSSEVTVQGLPCAAGQERVYNFAVVPDAVSSEQKAQIDAVP